MSILTCCKQFVNTFLKKWKKIEKSGKKIGEKMEKFKCISSFEIKVIAIITMLIDHFGYFFSNVISYDASVACRLIGRISMPLFAFLIYQGFKNTKNIDKYILRVLKCAVITQAICIFLGIFLNKIRYDSNIYFYEELNILFPFTISLIFLKVLDYLIKNKKKRAIDIISGITVLLLLISFFVIADIEYSVVPLLLIVGIYLFNNILKNNNILKVLIIITVSISLIFFSRYFELVYLIVILLADILYNGKKGYKSNKAFYLIYPIQYTIFLILKICGL